MYVPPPIPHAEDLKLSEFADLLRLPIDNIIEDLESEGYEITNNEVTLNEFALMNNTSPEKIYAVIFEKENFVNAGLPLKNQNIQRSAQNIRDNRYQEPVRTGQGAGRSTAKYYGRKTIRQLCDDAGISTEQGIALLKDQGLSNVKVNDRVKDVADKFNLRPSDISRYISKR